LNKTSSVFFRLLDFDTCGLDRNTSRGRVNALSEVHKEEELAQKRRGSCRQLLRKGRDRAETLGAKRWGTGTPEMTVDNLGDITWAQLLPNGRVMIFGASAINR